MLYLVGMGFTEKDITLKGLEIAKKAEECYAELYTSDWKGNLKDLERMIGKKIERLERSDLEEGLEEWLEKIKDKDAVLFVPGDPLVATTHASIALEAKKMGMETKIIHSCSIISAIAKTGLHVYKFGRTATIPWSGQMESVRQAIKTNKANGMHTLLLLDKGMPAEKGIEMLLAHGMINREERVIACSSLGTEREKIKFGRAENLAKEEFPSPACVVVPTDLHFTEKEFLQTLFGEENGHRGRA